MKANESYTLETLADLIGARLQGDPHSLISGIASLKRAKAGEISFLSNAEYRKGLPSIHRKDLASTKASAVILSADEAPLCPVHALISENPRLSLAKAAKIFQKKESVIQGIHNSVIIGEGCKIPSSVSIGANVVLGNRVILGENVVISAGCIIGHDCILGDKTTLMPRVTLYDNVQMGKHGMIYSGAVIGGDGFGFANQEGDWIRLPHLGSVVMGDNVEIGANTTIDRGLLEDTILGNGVVIDNLVQVGHNASIGRGTAIAGCVAIAGSAVIGKFCLIGGGSRIVGHIEIADHVHLIATSMVTHSLKMRGVYGGFPAKPVDLWRKNMARFHNLDDMARRLRAVEKGVLNNARLVEDE
jgi:UDP-3-O-[3-hydroxymyristoyl] glucosamine N-acyltransferase